MAHNILIVDDQSDIRQLLAGILTDEGYTPLQAAEAAEAMTLLKEKKPSLLLLDVWLNKRNSDGIKILEFSRQLYPDVPVIMISGHSTIEIAVSALKKGAYDFLEKPFRTERLLSVIKRGIELFQLQQEINALKHAPLSVHQFIGQSSFSTQIRQSIEKLAKSNSRILIEGPAGSGKNLIAELIHRQSERANFPFLKLNCSQLNADNIEEIFFGKETSIPEHTIRLGVLERANHGTLLLNNIHDLPISIQARLTSLIAHNQKFKRIGGNVDIDTDVRIISCTHLPLEEKITAGSFRSDLYYRLNVITLKVPPLCKRREDIPPLFDFFLSSFYGKEKSPTLTKEAFSLLELYPWQGNARQLRNVAEWLSIMHPTADEISKDMLPSSIHALPSEGEKIINPNLLLGLTLKEARESFEKLYLELQLQRCNGNISKTADNVKMERTALYRKMKILNLSHKADAQ